MNKSIIIIAVCILIVITVSVLVLMPHDDTSNWKHFEYWKSMYMEPPDSLIRRSNGMFDTIAKLAFDRVDLSLKQSIDSYLLCSKILINNAILNDNYELIANIYFDFSNESDQNTISEEPIQLMFDYIYKNCISAILITSNKLKDIRKIVNSFIDIYAYIHIIGIDKIPEYIYRLDTYYKSILNVKYHICNKIRHKFIKPVYTSDYQNTMDITVMRSVKTVIEILKESYYESDMLVNDTIDDIIEYYKSNPKYSKHIVSGLDRKPFLEMVIKILKNASNERGNIYSISVSETILLLWERIHHPKNSNVINILKQAMYDALFDCWNRGVGIFIPYCNNGQIAILIGMLALNDFDERTWNIQRTELIKNDIYNDIIKVLNYPNVNQRAIFNAILDRKLANPNIPPYIIEIIRYECSEAFL
jgi:hypothetical protein